MKYVRQILENKGHNIWSINPNSSVLDALKLMAEKNVGALLVLENEKIVGIFSERDYARKVILHGKSSKDTLVKEIMSTNVLVANPENTIEECMALMVKHHIRHLPILENDELIGMISIGDVVNAIIDEKEFTIKQLERYISGHH